MELSSIVNEKINNIGKLAEKNFGFTLKAKIKNIEHQKETVTFTQNWQVNVHTNVEPCSLREYSSAAHADSPEGVRNYIATREAELYRNMSAVTTELRRCMKNCSPSTLLGTSRFPLSKFDVSACSIETCDSCQGRGDHHCRQCRNGYNTCTSCGGRGLRQQWDSRAYPTSTPDRQGGYVNVGCSTCGQSGRLSCRTCGSTGRVSCGRCDATGRLAKKYVTLVSASATLSCSEPNSRPLADFIRSCSPSNAIAVASNTDAYGEEVSGGGFLYKVEFRSEFDTVTAEVSHSTGESSLEFVGTSLHLQRGDGILDGAVANCSASIAKSQIKTGSRILSLPGVEGLVEGIDDSLKMLRNGLINGAVASELKAQVESFLWKAVQKKSSLFWSRAGACYAVITTLAIGVWTLIALRYPAAVFPPHKALVISPEFFSAFAQQLVDPLSLFAADPHQAVPYIGVGLVGLALVSAAIKRATRRESGSSFFAIMLGFYLYLAYLSALGVGGYQHYKTLPPEALIPSAIVSSVQAFEWQYFLQYLPHAFVPGLLFAAVIGSAISRGVASQWAATSKILKKALLQQG